MDLNYIVALVLLAFVTGIIECMNQIVLLVLLVFVTVIMEVMNAIYHNLIYHGTVDPYDEFLLRLSRE